MSGSVKTAAEWFERDEVEALGAEAVMLHLSALAYSARHLKDGHVPVRQLRRLWPVVDLAGTVRRLLEAGWWREVQDGYYLPDWHDHILASGEVEHIREQTRIRVERHRRHKADDHTLCDRCSFVRRNGVTNGVSDGVSNTPSEPNRTEPTRRGGSEVEVPGGPDVPSVHRLKLDDDGYSCTCGLPARHPIHVTEVSA